MMKKPIIQVSGLTFLPGSDSVEWGGTITFDGWDKNNQLFPKSIKEPLTKEEMAVLEDIVGRIQGKKAKEPVPEPAPVVEAEGEGEVVEP